jgi:methyl-accepting chemotaxis protein
MKTRSSWTLGRKTAVALGASAALALVLAGVMISSLTGLKSTVTGMAHVTGKKIRLIASMRQAQAGMLAAQTAVIMNSQAGRASEAASARRVFREALSRAEQAVDDLRPLIATDQGRQLWAAAQDAIQQWSSAADEIFSKCETQNVAEAVAASDVTAGIHQRLDRVAEELERSNFKVLQADEDAAVARMSRASTFALVLITLILGVCIVSVRWVRGGTVELTRLVCTMSASAEQVASASSQVASSSQALAQGASEQAASLQETSASSEEITSMTQKNADNCRTVADLMSEAERLVISGNRTLEDLVGSMQEMNKASEKVSRIIKVIDEIAFQTNILALNAAVEAARAGEAGMGFAVVADEVRNLAQRSAQAAKDTAGLIEESLSRSRESAEKLDQVATAMRSITDSAASVKTLVDEVNVSSQEQARGMEQIARSVSQMDKVTQQTAASAEESASAAEELSAQAKAMQAALAKLQDLVGSGGAANSRVGAIRTKPGRSAAVASTAPALRPAAVAAHPQPAPHLSRAEGEFPLEDFPEA